LSERAIEQRVVEIDILSEVNRPVPIVLIQTLIETLSRTIVAMIDASTRWPSIAEIALAPRRMMTSGFANRCPNGAKAEGRRRETGSFGPHCSSRFLASPLVKPGRSSLTAHSGGHHISATSHRFERSPTHRRSRLRP
jgi:hypothetical protein